MSVEEQVRLARRGEHERLICRLPSGWLFLGVYQYLPGYCVLASDPVLESLNALPLADWTQSLLTMSVVDDVLLETTGAARINYAVLGNGDPTLHAHIRPRYAYEDAAKRRGSVDFYGNKLSLVPFDLTRDRPLIQAIRNELELYITAV